MEDLFRMYNDKNLKGNDTFELFKRFFYNDRTAVEEWLGNSMSKLETKNNSTANKLKNAANEWYTKNNFKQSLRLYTKAMCNAVQESEVYAIILANRSAVLYMMKNYIGCLSDTKLCLECNECPQSIQLKVLLRKIKCLALLKRPDDMNCAVAEAYGFLNESSGLDKDKIKREILAATLEETLMVQSESASKIPSLKEGSNGKFLYASAALQLRCNKVLGRHVTAKKSIEPDEVLFVEKPFAFAPVFINEEMDLPLNKCYSCLKDVSSCIPCESCTKCIFCDSKCLISSREYHKWECRGMQAGLWYKIGIAFPALRACIKGAFKGFFTLKGSSEDDTSQFGDEVDNYPFFDRLISNIEHMKNILPLVISATVIVCYLKNYTNFFEWLKTRPLQFEENDLVVLTGGLLTKHIAQMQCNSSTIYHKEGDTEVPVACAIYPSISMMNHSCYPNISIEYVQDIAIVRAAEAISENEEICNCYGIDYRFEDLQSRKEHLKAFYYFDCQCRACKLT